MESAVRSWRRALINIVTIAAAFQLENLPILFGDLLISGPERLDKIPTLPITGQVTRVFPAGSGWSITGMRQKVNLIAPNCVIGWAGSQLGATAIAKDLQAQAAQTSLASKWIDKYLATLDPSIEKLGVSLVGWVLDETGLHRFWYDAETFTLVPLGKMTVVGSGT